MTFLSTIESSLKMPPPASVAPLPSIVDAMMVIDPLLWIPPPSNALLERIVELMIVTEPPFATAPPDVPNPFWTTSSDSVRLPPTMLNGV